MSRLETADAWQRDHYGDGHHQLMSSGEERLVVVATLVESVKGSRFRARAMGVPRVSYAYGHLRAASVGGAVHTGTRGIPL